ncbi:MAG TPA: HAMP domain-containing protein [Ktedonobacteraceae bacterium]|nr:HAMP domain-containing protein [Ktedonobacteraceae bacterium]
MWQFLTNMSIARRLMLAAVITALVPGIVISMLGSSYVSTLSSVNDTVQAEDNAVKLVTNMQADLLRMNALLGTLNMTPSSAADNVLNSREITQLQDNFGATLATYQKDYQITTSAKMEGIREALKSDSQGSQEPISQHSMIYVVNLQWDLYSSAQQQVLTDVAQHSDGNTLAADIANANLEYLPLKGNLDNLVELTESISQIVVQLNTFKIYPIFFWTIVAFLFSTLVVFATSYVINLTITRPLRQLIQLTERIAQGDTNARAVVKGHDETYMVAASMNTMLDSIVNLMKHIQQQHDCLEAHVQKLIDEVKGLGSGDLRGRAEVTADALGFLAHSFNYMIDELSGKMLRIKTVTREVDTLTSATQQHITQLLQESTQRMQRMSEAAAMMEHMLATTVAASDQSLALTTGEAQQVPQVPKLENINALLSEQLQLTRSVLYSMQNEVEADRKSSAHEATHNIGQLAQLVDLLQSSLGSFKLREEV